MATRNICRDCEGPNGRRPIAWKSAGRSGSSAPEWPGDARSLGDRWTRRPAPSRPPFSRAEPGPRTTVRSTEGQNGASAMTQDREHRTRERAHAIWEREGRPHGRHEDHWHQASQEIGDELFGDESTTTSQDRPGALDGGLLPAGGLVAAGGPAAPPSVASGWPVSPPRTRIRSATARTARPGSTRRLDGDRARWRLRSPLAGPRGQDNLPCERAGCWYPGLPFRSPRCRFHL